MRIRSIAALVAAAGPFLGLTTWPVAQNTSNDALRLLVSNSMKGSMEALQAQCERAIGRPLAIAFSSTASLKKRIEMREAFDAAIVRSEAIDHIDEDSNVPNLLIREDRELP